MRKQIRMANINCVKNGKAFSKATRGAVEFLKSHKTEILGGGLLVAIGENIRVHALRKRDQKIYKESSMKQQTIARKHEAEINELKVEAEQAQKTIRRLNSWNKS